MTDSKFWSRKLLAATLSAGALVLSWVACQWLTVAREYYGTLATSVVALFTAYSGANVAAGIVAKRSGLASRTYEAPNLVAKRVAPKSEDE